MKKVGVIGAGAWGTALALSAHRAGNQVFLWSPFSEEVEAFKNHKSALKMPDVKIPDQIKVTSDLEEATFDAKLLVLSPPAQRMRELCQKLKPIITDDLPLVITSKGIDNKENKLMTEVIEEILPKNPIAVLSGPSFATEVARNMPTAVTIAAKNKELALGLCQILNSRHFRPYASTDVIGVQIGGSMKNVIAIACGIIDGMNLGESAKASMVTRGLTEISRLGVAMGARLDTFLGLSGVGDLTLTCLSLQSRNMSFGHKIGQGEELAALMANGILTEGTHTVSSAVSLAHKYGVEMPITFAVNRLIHEGGLLQDLIEDLLTRPVKGEAA